MKKAFNAFRVLLLVQYSLFRHKRMSWLQVLANSVFLSLLMVSPKVKFQSYVCHFIKELAYIVIKQMQFVT